MRTIPVRPVRLAYSIEKLIPPFRHSYKYFNSKPIPFSTTRFELLINVHDILIANAAIREKEHLKCATQNAQENTF